MRRKAGTAAEPPESPVEAVFQLLDGAKLMMVDIFRKLDADGSGTIELPDLHNVFKRLGLEVSQEAAAAFFRILDADGDGERVCVCVCFWGGEPAARRGPPARPAAPSHLSTPPPLPQGYAQ